MGNGKPDLGSFRSCGSLDKDFIILLDEYLYKSLQRINVKFRYFIVSKYNIKSALYILNYEKLFPNETIGGNHLTPELFNEFTNIYRDQKFYTDVLSEGVASPENFFILCGIVSVLIGIKAKDIRKYYDPHQNQFKLFEALDYFLFKSPSFKGDNKLLICHYLQYTTEFRQYSKKKVLEIMGTSKERLYDKMIILNSNLNDYISKFKVFRPWMNYKTSLGLTDGVVKFNENYIETLREDENAENITLLYFAKVLCVIYGYCRRTFYNGDSYYHFLIKTEIAKKFHISPRDKDVVIRKTVKKTKIQVETEKMFLLISLNLPPIKRAGNWS